MLNVQKIILTLGHKSLSWSVLHLSQMVLIVMFKLDYSGLN